MYFMKSRNMFITLVFIFSIMMTTMIHAISFNELENRPNIIKVDTKPLITAYLDTSSVQVLRYEPPFYTIQYVEYIVDYENMQIVEDHLRGYYDLRKTVATMYKDSMNELSTQEDFDNFVENKRENTGLMLMIVGGTVYDFNGEIKERLVTAPRKIKSGYGGAKYLVANKAFGIAYGKDFDVNVYYLSK